MYAPLQINPTIFSNKGSSKNDFHNFKNDFQFKNHILLNKSKHLELRSNILQKNVDCVRSRVKFG